MVAINYANREVSCKIVYYGPGLSGKTTNLQYIHSKVPNTTRGDLISLATDADRTLYFDFLPINIGSINGFTTRFQLYTVPGQVFYNATRKLVLRGVDGLIFVADSQRDKADENVESLNNLKENLAEYGYALEDIPIILQYNKVDLPEIMTVEEMDQLLNSHNWPTFTSVAHQGKGVFDTLKLIIKLILENVKKSGTAKKIAENQKPQPSASPEPQSQPAQASESGAVAPEHGRPQQAGGSSAQRSQPEPAQDGRLAASAGETASSVAVADMPQQDPGRQDMQATDKIRVEQEREAAEAERAEAEAVSSNDPARQEDTYIGQKPEQQEMSAEPEPDEQTVETDETRAEEDQDLMIKRADQESYVEDQPQDKSKPQPQAEEIQPEADYDEPEEVTEMPEETPAPEEEAVPEPARDEAGEEDDQDEYEEDIFALPTERPKMAAPLKAKKKKKGFFLFRLFKKK